MKINEPGTLFPLIALVLMAGCAMGPNYKPVAVDTPGNFRFASTQTTNSFGDLPWWQVFKDSALQDLIHIALTNNYDLKQAVARVEQARQQVTVARAPLLPANRVRRRCRARKERAIQLAGALVRRYRQLRAGEHQRRLGD